MSPILEAYGLTAAYRSWLACDCHPLFPLFHQYSPFSLTSISFPPWFCSSQLVKYISSPNNQMMLFVFNFILHFCLNCLNFKKNDESLHKLDRFLCLPFSIKISP